MLLRRQTVLKDFVDQILQAENNAAKTIEAAEQQAKEMVLKQEKLCEQKKSVAEKKLLATYQTKLDEWQENLEKDLQNQIDELKSKPIVFDEKKFAKAKQIVLREVLKL